MREYIMSLYVRFKQNKGTTDEADYKIVYDAAKNQRLYRIKKAKMLENDKSYINQSQNKCKAVWTLITIGINNCKKTDSFPLWHCYFCVPIHGNPKKEATVSYYVRFGKQIEQINLL